MLIVFLGLKWSSSQPLDQLLIDIKLLLVLQLGFLQRPALRAEMTYSGDLNVSICPATIAREVFLVTLIDLAHSLHFLLASSLDVILRLKRLCNLMTWHFANVLLQLRSLCVRGRIDEDIVLVCWSESFILRRRSHALRCFTFSKLNVL